MLYVYSLAEQTIAVDAPVAFSSIGLSKGKYVIQSTESTITINCPGIYEVIFNGTASAAGGVQLTLNGLDVEGALAEGTSLAFTALVRVNPNCCAISTNLPARLQVVNSGAADLTLTNAALTIIKVG